MLSEKDKQDKIFYNFKLDDYVPEDHLVRYIDKYIQFDFIRDKVKHLYSHTGRPSIDPVVLFKMMLLGYLYNIPSERQLENEINVNLAFRWFIKYDIDEPIPDHSTISQTRRRKFCNSNLFREIFETIINLCKEHGFIAGDTIMTDSTHIKANASLDSLQKIVITPEEFIKRLDDTIGGGKHGEDSSDTPRYSNDSHKSTTDPDSKLMKRPGKPRGLFYLEHRSIDCSGYIVDSFISPGNVLDYDPYIDRIQYMQDMLKLPIKYVVADRGYGIAKIYKQLTDLEINAIIPQRFKEVNRPGMFKRKDFLYNAKKDVFMCPAGQQLHRRSKKPKVDGTFEYTGRKKDCNNACIYRKQCTNAKGVRHLKRHQYQEYIDYHTKDKDINLWRKLLRKRKTILEGSFATAKMFHGLARAKLRGIKKVQEQALMTAITQNIKKFIKDMKRLDKIAENAIYSLLKIVSAPIWRNKRAW